MKKLLALLLVLAMLLTLAACGGAGNEPDATDSDTQGNTLGAEEDTQGGNEVVTGDGPQYGGHINVRIVSRPTGYDPLKQTGVWRYLYTTCVYENALTRDADNNIAPGVCDFELSEDQLVLKLWVRDGMMFHNGDKVEITDVKASIQRSLNLYNSMKIYVKPYVASMEIDGDVLTITFSEYREKCLHYLAAYQTWCAIIPEEICEKYATDYIVDQVEDAIGTGPYRFTDFKDSVYISMEKWEDYVPLETDATGFAGTKYGYVDSMTFWYNSDDSSAALALLSGDYDMVEVLPSDYQDMATAQGLNCEILDSNTGTAIIFNQAGLNNLCAKYPSLRKAIMAAIDYEEFLGIVTDEQQVMGGAPALLDLYDNGVFESADYYGEADQDVVDKYLEMARNEGYDDEPVRVVFNNTRTDIPTLLCDYLDEAGINYKLTTMEATTYDAFIGSTGNNWDFYFTWPNFSSTPSLMPAVMIDNNYSSTEKDTLLNQLYKLDPQSQEYLDVWKQLSELLVEDCAFAYMSMINWFWWHPETLHSNDSGLARYVYNSYWDDPANHTN